MQVKDESAKLHLAAWLAVVRSHSVQRTIYTVVPFRSITITLHSKRYRLLFVRRPKKLLGRFPNRHCAFDCSAEVARSDSNADVGADDCWEVQRHVTFDSSRTLILASDYLPGRFVGHSHANYKCDHRKLALVDLCDIATLRNEFEWQR